MTNVETNSINSDLNPWKSDFPIFDNNLSEKPLVFLDSAASAQKPNIVINTVRDFYESFVLFFYN